MSSSRLVRGAKTRMFACVCLMCVLGALLYLFHGTQGRLADLQRVASDCTQQQESLSAQLQVIFEYKLRLEKSLKKEKADHEQTKEMWRVKEKEQREGREKERAESLNKYQALVQQNKLQKSQFEDQKETLEKNAEELKEEVKRLEHLVELAKEDMKVLKTEKENSIESIKTDYLALQLENKNLKAMNEDLKAKALPADEKANYLDKQNFQLETEVNKLKESLSQCERENSEKDNKPVVVAEVENSNALEPPKFVQIGNSSTTPGINPDALYSPDLSSAKPHIQRKSDEQVAVPPKKSTQETGGGMELGNVIGQIPGPPEPPPHREQSPLGPLNPVMIQDRRDAAIEEDDTRQRIGLRGRGEHNYHAGDYDKEQPEEEEDDEAEQLDYVQSNNDQMRKEPAPRHAHGDLGIMVNPK